MSRSQVCRGTGLLTAGPSSPTSERHSLLTAGRCQGGRVAANGADGTLPHFVGNHAVTTPHAFPFGAHCQPSVRRVLDDLRVRLTLTRPPLGGEWGLVLRRPGQLSPWAG